MSTEIKIKRGSGITPALADGELGYNKDTKTLTIGTNGTVAGNVNLGRPIETVPQEDYDSYVSEGTVDKDTIYIIESDDAVVTESVLKDKAFSTEYTLDGNYDNAPLGTWWTRPEDGNCMNQPSEAQMGYLTTTKPMGTTYQIYQEYSTGMTYTRNNAEGTFLSWTRTDGIDKAPSGYGYGGKITTKIYNTDGMEADFLAKLEAAYSAMSDETAMQVQFVDVSIGTGFTFTGTLYKNWSDYGWLKGTSYNGCTVQRFKQDGTWSKAEWENPPMYEGDEYRTTERYNGKPVYVKTFSASFNSISAAGTVKDLLIPHGLPNHYIVRVEATAGTYMFPSIMDRDSFTSIYTIDATNITIRVCDDNWNGSIRFTLYYTKD